MLRKVLCGLMLLASSARAGYIDDSVAAYKRGSTVYVSDLAELKVQSNQLAGKIVQGSVPIFIAVLPQAATNEAPVDELPLSIARRIEVPVAVGVIAGKSFRANAVNQIGNITQNSVGSLATVAFNSSRAAGPQAVLLDWVDRLQVASGVESPRASTSRIAQDTITTPAPVKQESKHHYFLWFLGLVGLGGGVWYWRKRVKANEALWSTDSDAIEKVYETPEATTEKVNDNGTPTTVTTVGGKPFHYSRTPVDSCPHYYDGGYYQGRYVSPGYYNDPFWNYMMLSAVLSSQHDHSSYMSNVQSTPQTAPAHLADANPPPVESHTDRGSYVAPEPSHQSSYETPAPSGGGSFDSGSSGGGSYDSGFSGGGSFDSGSFGGGGDFGGGGGGGGDF